MSNYVKLPILEDSGYVVLDPDADTTDPAEWTGLEYTEWRSSGVTRFAPLASFAGEVESNAFWNHTPPRTDKNGVWVDSQATIAPSLVRRAQEPGAGVGRCRVIELQPNTYADAVYNLHLDDNNRLNPSGTGWVVRGYVNLTDDPDSFLLLREDRFDAATEVRIPLAVGTRVIIDTQRVWHAVWHAGPAPRYSLITSWESGPELSAYVAAEHGRARVESAPLDARTIDDAQIELHRRLEERQRAFEAQGRTLEETWLSEN